MEKNPDPGWEKFRIRDPRCTSEIIFLRAWKQFLGLKYLYSLMRIRIQDPESFSPWIRDGKIWIRNKHPGSAILYNLYYKTWKRKNEDFKYFSKECGILSLRINIQIFLPWGL
jgi:hypothetical protein